MFSCWYQIEKKLGLFYYRTLTTPVELIKCLKSIKEHAFVASEYPVVITLEDHLTPDLQAKVAQVGICDFLIRILSSHVLIFTVLSPIFSWSLKHLETYCFHLAQSA